MVESDRRWRRRVSLYIKNESSTVRVVQEDLRAPESMIEVKQIETLRASRHGQRIDQPMIRS